MISLCVYNDRVYVDYCQLTIEGVMCCIGVINKLIWWFLVQIMKYTFLAFFRKWKKMAIL